MKQVCFAWLVFTIVQPAFSQQKPPTIRATSKTVDVRDGDKFLKGAWTISPEVRPDVYTTSSKGKRVVFHTDRDSIAVTITPTTKFAFVILLNDTVKALTEIRYKPGYLDILKTAGNYNPNDNKPFPKFTYQSKENANLIALRTGFKLDSVAGGGNEVSKILRLLHWVHDLIPHDGNGENPVVKNALSLVAQCKREGRGLNCRGLATVLNECYLSLGVPSRIVTCMPKDSVFDDCHVINAVYAEELSKWLWIDPTNDAYVMNEKGALLSIEEVRDRLIHNRPLILNPEANWNHRVSQQKEEYLYRYMAKNLYRLECPLESRYDYETVKEGKTFQYVELLPVDTRRPSPKNRLVTNSGTKTRYINYKTTNAQLFWALPGE